MTRCPFEAWADCLRYYGKDIWDMDGGEALVLIDLLPDMWDVDPTGRPLSAVANYWRRVNAQAKEDHVMSPDEIAAFVAANS